MSYANFARTGRVTPLPVKACLVAFCLSLPLQVSAPLMVPAEAAKSSGEQHCLATAIYFEARGEPVEGQRAVAQVIINRVKSKAYPSSICGVVFQNRHRMNACQFSFACDGAPETVREKGAWNTAQKVAADAMSGRSMPAAVKSATHYHATSVRPRWASSMQKLASIGSHVFYKG